MAVQGLCQEAGVIFMAALTHSNDTAGKDRRANGCRHVFGACMSAPCSAKPTAANAAPIYHLTADYTWGWTQQASIAAATEALDWKTTTNVLTPVGAGDFSSDIALFLNSGADVLVLIPAWSSLTAPQKRC